MDISHYEGIVNSLKVNDLQALLLQLSINKIGKKAELVQRCLHSLRNPTLQPKVIQKIHDMQRKNGRVGPYPVQPPRVVPQQQQPQYTNYANPSNMYAHMNGGAQPKRVQGLTPVPLPFFEVIDTLVEPTELAPAPGAQKMSAKQYVTINLPPARIPALSYNSEISPLPRYEVQLRFFHLGENWRGVQQPDDFPLNCAVRLEDQNVVLPAIIPTNRPNVEAKRPSRPVNLTRTIQGMGVSQRPYRLMVEWHADRRTWAFAVYIVLRVNTEILFNRLTTQKAEARQPESVTRNTIIRRLNTDDGIEMEQLKTSLRCPLMRTRQKLPVRCTDCTHLQCYDLTNYLTMNEKRPTWKCPVCSNPAPYDKLIIDQYFVNVLASTPDGIDDVELLVDGGWRVIKEEPCPSSDEDVKPTKKELQCISLDDGDRASSSTAPPAAKRKCPPPTDDDIIVLDSDDEDADTQQAVAASLVRTTPLSTPPPPPPGPSASNSSTARTTPTKRKDIEIITLDDTPPRPVARPEPSSSASSATTSTMSASSAAATPYAHSASASMSNGHVGHNGVGMHPNPSPGGSTNTATPSPTTAMMDMHNGLYHHPQPHSPYFAFPPLPTNNGMGDLNGYLNNYSSPNPLINPLHNAFSQASMQATYPMYGGQNMSAYANFMRYYPQQQQNGLAAQQQQQQQINNLQQHASDMAAESFQNLMRGYQNGNGTANNPPNNRLQ